MKKRAKLIVLLFLLSIFANGLVLAKGHRNKSKEKKIKPVLLRTQVAFSQRLPGLGSTIRWLAKRVETVSQGTIRLRVYEPGKKVKQDAMLDAVVKGQKINSGYAVSGYWEKKMPGISIFTAIPFGPETGEYLAWVYYGNGMKLWQGYYKHYGLDVHILPLGVIAPETAGWYRKPIKTIKDFKGLKIRYFGLAGRVLKRVGARVKATPGPKIYAGLKKGEIDATEFSMPAIDTLLGFYKVVRYNYFPGWHQQATFFEWMINGKTWRSLHPTQRMILEVLSRAATLDAFAFTESIQARVMKRNIEKRKVKIRYLSEDILKRLESEWNKVAIDMARKHKYFGKVWADYKAFRKEYDIWKAHAFLPR